MLLVTQKCPHLDAITAATLIQWEGEKLFPGTKDFRISPTWNTGTISPQGKSWKDYEKEGIILIGVGGSPFDEHASPEFGDRKILGESTTSLVAKALGIDQDLLYKRIIAEVTESDLKTIGDTGMFHMASVIQQMYRDGADPMFVIDWAQAGLRALAARQERYLAACGSIQNREGIVQSLPNSKNRLLAIDSDNDQIGPAARSLGFAVLIQRRSTGHTLIFSNKKLGIKMCKVARAIRTAELCARGKDREAKDYKSILKDPGQLELVPNWCYQVPGENLLNGTETVDGLEPTRIEPMKILELVIEHVSTELAGTCRRNIVSQ